MTLGARHGLLYPLYHPAAALYTPSMLKVLEEDFARIPALLERALEEPVPQSKTALAGRSSPIERIGSARPVLTVRLGARQRLGGRDGGDRRAAWPPRLALGDVVTVSGELGAGKTTFVRGACRALGVTSPVTSPTFTIGHRYAGDGPVTHLDLYRFAAVSPAEWGDLEPYFDDAIVFVEWPEAGVGDAAAAAGRRDARACRRRRRRIARRGRERAARRHRAC